MKKYLLIPVLVCILVSCKEDEPESEYHQCQRVLAEFSEMVTVIPDVQVVNNRYEIGVSFDFPPNVLYPSSTRPGNLAVHLWEIEAYDGDRKISGIFDGQKEKLYLDEYVFLPSFKCIARYYIYPIVSETDYDILAEKKQTFDITAPDVDYDLGEMVKFEYPFERQCNYMQADYQYGFLYFKTEPVFMKTTSKTYHATITDIATGGSNKAEMKYDQQLKILQYTMPALENEKIYRVDYTVTDSKGNTKELYQSNHFATSKFNRFRDKIEPYSQAWFNQKRGYINPILIYIPVVEYTCSDAEFLDYYELNQSPEKCKDRPINLVSNVIDKNVKLDNDELYSFGRKNHIQLTNRDTVFIGYKPFRNLFEVFNNTLAGKKITDEQIAGKSKDKYTVTTVYFSCIYPVTNYLDYKDLGSKKSVDLKNVDYKLSPVQFTMQYIIPGIEKVIMERAFALPADSWQ